jgi:hypothetical protein
MEQVFFVVQRQRPEALHRWFLAGGEGHGIVPLPVSGLSVAVDVGIEVLRLGRPLSNMFDRAVPVRL